MVHAYWAAADTNDVKLIKVVLEKLNLIKLKEVFIPRGLGWKLSISRYSHFREKNYDLTRHSERRSKSLINSKSAKQ